MPLSIPSTRSTSDGATYFGANQGAAPLRPSAAFFSPALNFASSRPFLLWIPRRVASCSVHSLQHPTRR